MFTGAEWNVPVNFIPKDKFVVLIAEVISIAKRVG